MKEKKVRSICLLVASILGILYSVYLIGHFGGVMTEDIVTGSIATAIITPHMLLVVLATIFATIGYAINKAGFALTAGILYSCSGLVFLMYILFVVPMIVLSFIGYAKVKKINRNTENTNQAS